MIIFGSNWLWTVIQYLETETGWYMFPVSVRPTPFGDWRGCCGKARTRTLRRPLSEAQIISLRVRIQVRPRNTHGVKVSVKFSFTQKGQLGTSFNEETFSDSLYK